MSTATISPAAAGLEAIKAIEAALKLLGPVIDDCGEISAAEARQSAEHLLTASQGMTALAEQVEASRPANVIDFAAFHRARRARTGGAP